MTTCNPKEPTPKASPKRRDQRSNDAVNTTSDSPQRREPIALQADKTVQR